MRILSILFICLSFGCSPRNENPHIEIQTRLGDIEVELYPKQAPKTVAAFLSYVDSGFYSNTSFYRVLNNGNQPSDAFKANLIQGGLWGSGRRKQLPGIPHETRHKQRSFTKTA